MTSFHLSCSDINIHQEHGSTFLTAQVRDLNGNMRGTKIRLDDHIGNSDGWFLWGGVDFTRSASNIRLEHTNRGPKLTADLETRDGGSRGRQGMFLGDKIQNIDGHLRYFA